MKWKQAIIILLTGISAGCSKNPAGILPPAPVDSTIGLLRIPFDGDSLMPTKALYIPPAKVDSVSGIFIANHQRRILRDTAGTEIVYDNDWYQVAFLDSSGSPNAYGGDVRLNSSLFSFGVPGAAYHNHNQGIWNIAGPNNWSVSGNSSVPPIFKGNDPTFPRFMATLPDTITTTGNPYSFTLNSSDLQYADSSYMVYYGKDNRLTYTNFVGRDGGNLAPQGPLLLENTLLFTHGKVYYGIWMASVTYEVEIAEFGGKRYAFVKQTQVLKNVVIR